MIGKKSLEQAFIPAVLIIMSSLISISLFINDFKISVAIVLLPLFIFLIKDLPVFTVAFISGLGVCFLRVFVYTLSNDSMEGAFSAYWPEIFFYFTYGFLLKFYLKKYGLDPMKVMSVLPLVFIDFTANFAEIILRLGTEAFVPVLLFQLIAVAAARSFMAWAFMYAFDYYGISVLKREDAKRYNKLVLMASELNSEICWIDKSSEVIENTMNKAYNLYAQLSEQEELKELSKSAMDIARDIHEVKKEYIVIVRGIKESLKNSTVEDRMDIKSVCSILKRSIRRNTDKTVNFQMDFGDNFYTDQHYLLMSVFNNLFTNAVEASKKQEVNIHFSCYEDEGQTVFVVKDDSGGIPEEHLDNIFMPFYSTKINYETGEINRGIGLCVVEEIVCRKFEGTMAVASENGSTVFTIKIPKKNLTGDV